MIWIFYIFLKKFNIFRVRKYILPNSNVIMSRVNVVTRYYFKFCARAYTFLLHFFFVVSVVFVSLGLFVDSFFTFVFLPSFFVSFFMLCLCELNFQDGFSSYPCVTCLCRHCACAFSEHVLSLECGLYCVISCSAGVGIRSAVRLCT